LCWSHARRKFFDIQAASKAPLAEEALRLGTTICQATVSHGTASTSTTRE
jgi:hypothetical protein